MPSPRTARIQRALLCVTLAPTVLALCDARPVPYLCGERLVYSAHAGPGLNGRAEMWVEGPVEWKGTSVVVFRSVITGGLGPFKLSDKTSSWFDTERAAALRFVKEERHPMGQRHDEDVEMNPATLTWRAADGKSGTSASNQPLDELSFIYALRSMDIPDDSTIVLNRHFDAERNPTRLRALGRGLVKTDAGTYATRDVEMRVRDARRYRGEGTIRISFSDDACRRPIRIESKIPNAGTVVMTLTSAEPAIPGCSPR